MFTLIDDYSDIVFNPGCVVLMKRDKKRALEIKDAATGEILQRASIQYTFEVNFGYELAGVGIHACYDNEVARDKEWERLVKVVSASKGGVYDP